MPRPRITLEPALELSAGHLSAEDCERLAAIHLRYAHQLGMRAAILRQDDGQRQQWTQTRLGRELVWMPAVGRTAE